MVASQSIREALQALIDQHLELELFVKACSDIGFGDGTDPRTPAWIFVAERQVDRVKACSVALETLLRQQALPRLEDMERVHTR